MNRRTARRQGIVVICNQFLSDAHRKKIREQVLEEMKDGVVVLPAGYQAIPYDWDRIRIGGSEDGEL